MKSAKRRQILLISVLVMGVLAWGYALRSWRGERYRVIVPRPAVAENDPGLPVLAACDVLEPVELSPELTPDEEAAANRIAQLVVMAREERPLVALDGKSSAPTMAKIMGKYNVWVHDLLHTSFQRCAKPDASWRGDAALWIDEFVANADKADRRAALRDTGRRLIDDGCDDWLVRYSLFRSHDDVDQPENAANAAPILQPIETLADSGYPPAITYRIYLAHAEAMSRLSRWQPVGLKQAMDGFAAAISEPLTDDERRFYVARFRSEMRGLFGRYLGELVGRLEAAPEADPWFVRLIQGIWHIERAWKLRGGGYADTVTEEGWRGFDAHLQKARILLLQCWEEHPECPEPASELIRVTMGIGGIANEGPRFWFDEAVAAQFDLRDAYERLRWALRPRWGGNHKEMLAFGRECLATERFDTDVPWQFHLALKEIGSEIGDRRDVYHLDGIYDDYQKLLAGYRERGEVTPKLTRRWDSRAACVAWLAGRNDAAKEILDRLGQDVDLEAFNDFETTIGEARRELEGAVDRAPIAKAEFSPGVEFASIAKHGHAVLVGGVFSGAQIADTQRGCQIIATLVPEPQQAYRGYSLSPHGTSLVTVPMPKAQQANSPTVLLWDIASQSKRRQWTVPGGAFLAAFSPDGRYVVVGGINGTVSIWDVSSERADPIAQSSGHSSIVCGLAFSQDGSRLATLGLDHRAVIWNIADDSPKLDQAHSESLAVEPFSSHLRSISLSPNGERLLVGGEHVALWNLATKEKQLMVEGTCCGFSPDGRRFVTGGGQLGTEARVWDAQTGNELMKLVGGHAYAISLAVFSNDGRRILTGERDNRCEACFVRCWDAESGEEVFDFNGLK
ncbi:MAG TPA: hypothetical protein VFI31_02385 [Pirellulales bacterium]|nr:hypothetical protein [Pirellulales bacterium]